MKIDKTRINIIPIFLSWLFLISVFIFTFFFLKDYWIFGDYTLSQGLFNVFVYVGSSYALLKMGNWI